MRQCLLSKVAPVLISDAQARLPGPRVPLLAKPGNQRTLLPQVALRLKTSVYLPGDCVIQQGDVGRELFIINKGSVRVLKPDEEVKPISEVVDRPPEKDDVILVEGQFFGACFLDATIAMLSLTKRMASLQPFFIREVNLAPRKQPTDSSSSIRPRRCFSLAIFPGEMALILAVHRTRTIVAQVICEVAVLSKHNFQVLSRVSCQAFPVE